MSGEYAAWATQVDATLAELLRALTAAETRLATLEAQLEALDASYIRHTAQLDDDLRRVSAAVDRVGEDLSTHLDAHWRSR